jgi:hypothetical protein
MIQVLLGPSFAVSPVISRQIRYDTMFVSTGVMN